eukprot:gb/GEZN01001512.1/.p1 GENE.gb/GEZN01001512.1/~~gb/GEZN01001512.1/.p1  ORF type:complete len:495 (+),score=75.83 gb/GEZN01001512.1/:1514-2998(+)
MRPHTVFLELVLMGITKNAFAIDEALRKLAIKFGLTFRGCRCETNVKHPFFSATTDSGGADPKAATLVACNQIRCGPHTCDSMCKDSKQVRKRIVLPELVKQGAEIEEKLTTLIGSYNKSNQKSNMLEAAQQGFINMHQLSVQPLALIQKQDTGWWSGLCMIRRALEPRVRSGLALVAMMPVHEDKKVSTCLPTSLEWKELSSRVIVYTPMESVSTNLEGAKYVTISRVFPFIQKMLDKFEELGKNESVESKNLTEMGRATAAFLHTRGIQVWDNRKRYAAAVATILDPPYKTMVWLNEADQDEAWSLLKDAVKLQKELIAEKADAAATAEAAVTSANVTSAPKKQDGVAEEVSVQETLLSMSVEESDSEEELEEDGKDEIEEYKKIKCRKILGALIKKGDSYYPNPHFDSFAFWRDRQDEFPVLSRVFRRYSSMSGSGAGVERVFAVSGYLGRARRAAMGNVTMNANLFIKQNEDWIEKQEAFLREKGILPLK